MNSALPTASVPLSKPDHGRAHIVTLQSMARDAAGAYRGHACSDLHGLVVGPEGDAHAYVDIKTWWPAGEGHASALYAAVAENVVRHTVTLVPPAQVGPVRLHVRDMRVRPTKPFESARLRRALVGAAEQTQALARLALVVSVQGP